MKRITRSRIEGWDDFKGHTPHRPFVDKIKIKCDDCGGSMSRIPEVGNPWLDAGIVSFRTLSYREDPEYWRQWFPANWISESFPGQFRNWFSSLLAMSTVLENKPPFLENFGHVSLLAEDGRQMHKSSGNSIEFNGAADRMGVDTMVGYTVPKNLKTICCSDSIARKRFAAASSSHCGMSTPSFRTMPVWIIGRLQQNAALPDFRRVPHQPAITRSISGFLPD